MESRLRSEAKALLQQGKVNKIVGFAAGSRRYSTCPVITGDVADIDQLVINPFIVNNLSVYLSGLEGRVAVVVKGCDSHSVVSLIQDKQLRREDLVIIGVPCTGLIDIAKIEKLTGRMRDEIEDIRREGDSVFVTVDGQVLEYSAKDVVFNSCLECRHPTPTEYDILLGEPTTAPLFSSATWERSVEFPAETMEERWAFWREEFSNCLRCYACRNVCPSCFCERCFAEETEPSLVSPLPRWQDNLLFQVGRHIHLAGRCVDCGACERVCPVNIPLRRLSREISDIVEDLYKYTAGSDVTATPFLADFEVSDPPDFGKL